MKQFTILAIGILFGVYAKFTGDYKPLIGFVAVAVGVFALDLVNTILGKIKA